MDNAYEVFINTKVPEMPFWRKDSTLRMHALREYANSIIWETTDSFKKMSDLLIRSQKGVTDINQLEDVIEKWQLLADSSFQTMQSMIDMVHCQSLESEINDFLRISNIVLEKTHAFVKQYVECELPSLNLEKIAEYSISDTIDNLFDSITINDV